MSGSSSSRTGTKKQQQQQQQQPRARAAQAHAEKTAPPAPFSPLPEPLTAFADILDKTKVYIVHLDTQPRALKRQVFAVPLLLNLTIAALLAWRAYHAVPKYVLYVLTILGQQTSETVDANALTSGQLAAVVARRVAMIACDYVLAAIVLPWPFSFFLDFPGNPVTWRWRVGFRDTEVVVRESRGWGALDLVGGRQQGSASPFWANRVAPVVEMRYIRGKTGYVMMGKDWDLDFERMIWAEEWVRRRDGEDRSLSNFRTNVLVHSEAHGWLSWTPDWEHSDKELSDEARERRTIQDFHARLTALGKESLFFRWIELLQFETNRPSAALQPHASLLRQARAMFAEHGVDFDAFAESLGGVQALPGLSGAVASF